MINNVACQIYSLSDTQFLDYLKSNFNLNDNALNILKAVHDYNRYYPDGDAEPAQSTLANLAGCSIATVKRWLDVFRNAGILTTIYRYKQTSIYKLHARLMSKGMKNILYSFFRNFQRQSYLLLFAKPIKVAMRNPSGNNLSKNELQRILNDSSYYNLQETKHKAIAKQQVAELVSEADVNLFLKTVCHPSQSLSDDFWNQRDESRATPSKISIEEENSNETKIRNSMQEKMAIKIREVLGITLTKAQETELLSLDLATLDTALGRLTVTRQKTQLINEFSYLKAIYRDLIANPSKPASQNNKHQNGKAQGSVQRQVSPELKAIQAANEAKALEQMRAQGRARRAKDPGNPDIFAMMYKHQAKNCNMPLETHEKMQARLKELVIFRDETNPQPPSGPETDDNQIQQKISNAKPVDIVLNWNYANGANLIQD